MNVNVDSVAAFCPFFRCVQQVHIPVHRGSTGIEFGCELVLQVREHFAFLGRDRIKPWSKDVSAFCGEPEQSGLFSDNYSGVGHGSSFFAFAAPRRIAQCLFSFMQPQLFVRPIRSIWTVTDFSGDPQLHCTSIT